MEPSRRFQRHYSQQNAHSSQKRAVIMMRPGHAPTAAIATKNLTLLLCSLLALSTLAACGVTTTTQLQSSISNIPVGTGNAPEQGNSGKPAPNPTGHGESFVTGNNV